MNAAADDDTSNPSLSGAEPTVATSVAVVPTLVWALLYASGLIAAGCDVVTVQRALGHSSAAITLTTYSHLWPDANDRTRKAADGLVDQAIGSTADALRTEGRN